MSESAFRIRPMSEDDWPQVEAIYRAGIGTGNATFELEPPDWTHFDTGKLRDHRWVAIDVDSGDVVGWVAAGPTSSRAVYAGVIEHSVYVRPDSGGRGIGTALVTALITSTEAAGIWTIQSSIFPENTASLELHRRLGFRSVGIRERVARHHGRWRDTVLIERRSRIVGPDDPPL